MDFRWGAPAGGLLSAGPSFYREPPHLRRRRRVVGGVRAVWARLPLRRADGAAAAALLDLQGELFQLLRMLVCSSIRDPGSSIRDPRSRI